MSNYEKCKYRLRDRNNTEGLSIRVDGEVYVPIGDLYKLLDWGNRAEKPSINREKLENVLTAYEQHDVLRLLASGVVDN